MHRAFEVTVLGTSSASPTKTRHPSAQFVRMEGDYFLLDCGEGTQLQMVRFGLRMHRIQYVLITHMHGDHFFGLPGLVTSMGLFGRTEPLTIAGPANLEATLKTILESGDTRLPFDLDFIVCNPFVPEIIIKNGGWQIESVPLKHRIDCTGYILRETGPELKLNVKRCEELSIPISAYESIKYGADYRLDDGHLIANHELTLPGNKNRSYAYISDTIYDENVASFVSGVDLLYHESTFLHDLKKRALETFHTTAKEAGITAKNAGVKKLLVGHFSARYHTIEELTLEAREVFPNTEAAEEGKTYQV
ncbi:MAG: ribonuclease Z [Bacteroidetes bacterium]|nr:ribonuclease Z [Bacteroidota bacterium]